MLIKEIVDTLDEMAELRPTNPEWWGSYGNEAISQAVMIIRKWQNLTSTDSWADANKIEREESR